MVKDIYEVDVIARAKRITKTEKEVKSLARTVSQTRGLQGFGKVNEQFIEMNQKLQTQQQQLQRAQLQTSKVGRAWEQSKQGLLGFNGSLLSTLFFGMAIKNVFQSALKSIFDSYKKIIPENSKFNKEVTKLSANWEFFKFQLADALVNSKVFDVLIAGAVKLIGWFNGLSDSTQKWITIGLGIGLLIGAFMLFIGIMGSGVASTINLAVAMGIMKASTLSAVGPKVLATIRLFWLTLIGPIGWFVAGVAGAMALSANIIDKWLVDEGKTIKGFWKNFFAVLVTFWLGLTNIVILAVTGIIGIFTTLYDAWVFIMKSMVDVASSFGKAVRAAIKAGLSGGDWKSAFLDNFNFTDIGTQLANNFTSSFQNGATAKLGTISKSLTDTVNKWNKEQIDKLSTPVDKTNQELQSFQNQFGASNIPNVEPTGTGGGVQSIQNYNIQIGDDSFQFDRVGGSGSKIRASVEEEMRDRGLLFKPIGRNDLS